MKIFAFFTLLFTLPLQISSVSYNYSYYNEVIHSAPGMTFAAYFNAQTLGTKLSSPEDMLVFEDLIYIIDSVENAIIVVDQEFNLVDEVKMFPYTQAYIDKQPEDFTETETRLNGALGLEVKSNAIYIADTGNKRIVKLNRNFEVLDIFTTVDDPTFDKLNFEPIKITVDATDRMYVIAKNVYEGIIELSATGEFNRFTGVNPIKLTPYEIFRRNLMTEAQLAQLKLFLPTEYTNVVLNEESFIYATSKPSENNAQNTIQLINPKGIDVIKQRGYFPPMGDIHYLEGGNKYVLTGPSLLQDIAYTDHGIYTVLDQKRSRLFTYDQEGNLLYINSAEGQQSDKFSEGVALAYLNDDIMVLDRESRTVIVYRLTDFGRSVNQAVKLQNMGLFDQAAEIWHDVLVLNTNYEVSYNGIGKYLLRQGEYKEAMAYFKLGHDDFYYSKAFKGYRNEILRENFGWIMGGTVLVAGLFVYIKIRKTIRSGGHVLYED